MSDSNQPINNNGQPLTGKTFEPRVELFQKKDNLYMYVELPGLETENDIELHLHDRNLSIRGHVNRTVKDGFYHAQERRFGSFYRQVSLPVPVQARGATANYQHGILEIKLKQKELGKGNRIKVRIKDH